MLRKIDLGIVRLKRVDLDFAMNLRRDLIAYQEFQTRFVKIDSWDQNLQLD